MSLLDLIGLNRIFKSGTPVDPTRKVLNFIGDGVTIVDNPGQNRTDITITSSAADGTVIGPNTSVAGNVAAWAGTDGTELADTGVAIADLATETYVDDAIALLPVGGDVVGPADSADNEIARYHGTGGKTIQRSAPQIADDGRITGVTNPTGTQDADTKAARDTAIAAAVAALTSSTAQYKGGSYTPNELRYVSGAWTGLVSAVFSGTWTDEVQNAITRSGENFTVTKPGLYAIDLCVPSFTSGAPPLHGLRVLVNGVQSSLSGLDYGGAAVGTTSDAGLRGFLSLGAGDVVSFQYINITGTTVFGPFTNGQMGGSNVKSLRVEMALIGGAVGPRGLPGAGGWQTYCDFNFTQMAAQTIGSGVNVIDGVQMRADNVVNATTFAIVAGTGLYLKNTTTGSIFYYSGRTAPLLYVDLPVDIPGWIPDVSEVRISAEWFTTVATANYSCSGIGVAKAPLVANNDLSVHFWHQYSGGSMRRATARLYTASESSPAISSAYNTGLIHYRSQHEHTWFAKTNAAADVTPNATVLDPATMDVVGRVLEAPGATITAGRIAAAGHHIAFWTGHPDNTLGNAEHVCKRLRIEYKL